MRLDSSGYHHDGEEEQQQQQQEEEEAELEDKRASGRIDGGATRKQPQKQKPGLDILSLRQPSQDTRVPGIGSPSFLPTSPPPLISIL